MSASCDPDPTSTPIEDPFVAMKRPLNPRTIFAPLAMARLSNPDGFLDAKHATNRTAFRKADDGGLRTIARNYGVPLDTLRERIAHHAAPCRWHVEVAAWWLRDELSIRPSAEMDARRTSLARWCLGHGNPSPALALKLITKDEADGVLRCNGRLPPEQPAHRPGPGDDWPVVRRIMNAVADEWVFNMRRKLASAARDVEDRDGLPAHVLIALADLENDYSAENLDANAVRMKAALDKGDRVEDIFSAPVLDRAAEVKAEMEAAWAAAADEEKGRDHAGS